MCVIVLQTIHHRINKPKSRIFEVFRFHESLYVSIQTSLTIEDDWRPPTPIEPSDRGRFGRTVSEIMAKQPQKWNPHAKH